MKILLTGASGLLGRTLYRHLNNCGKGFAVTGTAFARAKDGLLKLDLTKDPAVSQTIEELNPDIIIHAAAERKPDIVKVNPEMAELINVTATESIARAALKNGATVFYISTNYVFDGTNPPYHPDSATNPLNEYGRMKLEGEKLIEKICPDGIILRIPILYGPVEYLGESAVTAIAEGILKDSRSYFDNRMIRFPTHAADISSVISGLVELIDKGRKISGIYHWSGSHAWTKYKIAKLTAEIAGIDPDLICEAEADPDAAPRPENAKLDTESVRRLGLGGELDFETALRAILSPFH